MSRRGSAITAILVLAVLVAAPIAQAKLVLRFDRATARVGESVTVTFASHLGDDTGPWRIYLVRAPFLGHTLYVPYGGGFRTRPPSDPRIRFVGRAARGVGRLAIRVPSIRPGRYALLAWCTGCGWAPLEASYFSGVPDGAYVRAPGAFLTVRR